MTARPRGVPLLLARAARTGAGCVLLLAAAVVLATGCGERMRDQSRVDPLARSEFFPDGRAARDPVPGTVPVAPAVSAAPLAGRTLLERGRERYAIFCSPCHGTLGDGRGMVVRHGFAPPISFHDSTVRAMSDTAYLGHIEHGRGPMVSYASQVLPADRIAIVAYIRALQRSQHATLADVPPAERRRMEALR